LEFVVPAVGAVGIFIWNAGDAMTDADAIILTSSEALARLARERDPQAWSALIDRHGAAILRAAGRVTNDAALREDICQETLLQIRAHAGDFRPHPFSTAKPGHPHPSQNSEVFARAWVMRIACCTALKMIRTRARSAERETKLPPAVPPASPAETVVAQEQAEQVRREVAALPVSHRDAVSLRFFGECAYAEIAATLTISEEAAKKRVQRGLDLLRARLSAGGVALSAALLVSVLEQGTARASEATVASAAGSSAAGSTGANAASECAVEVLDLSRRAAWQALVNSSQAPALTGVVLSGGISMLAKAGMGIAAAALLALGVGGSMELRASRQMAEHAAASAKETAQQARALETKLEGSRNEIDALRRVVESRNSELTSLRDKVAEMDKRGVAGARFGGPQVAGDQVFMRKVGDKTISVRGADGNDIPLPDVRLFADAIAWQQDDKGNREIQFPGGKMTIQMQADADVNAKNPPDQLPPQGAAPNPQPNTLNPRQLRVQLPPGVVPPAPPTGRDLPPAHGPDRPRPVNGPDLPPPAHGPDRPRPANGPDLPRPDVNKNSNVKGKAEGEF